MSLLSLLINLSINLFKKKLTDHKLMNSSVYTVYCTVYLGQIVIMFAIRSNPVKRSADPTA